LQAYTTKVCTDTEDVFNDEFWTGLDGVCNALDNIHARLYVDSKCVFFGKSLLESGTLGTKVLHLSFFFFFFFSFFFLTSVLQGNTQVMVPGVSQTYGETSDPEPKETAKCLLHSFPSNVEHCLQVLVFLFFCFFFLITLY
jgi:ubiquitin-activating enzyme E1